MNKPEQVLIDALKRLVRLNAYEESGEECFSPSVTEWRDAWAQAIGALDAVNDQGDPGDEA
jgi:hypothetical protein